MGAELDHNADRDVVKRIVDVELSETDESGAKDESGDGGRAINAARRTKWQTVLVFVGYRHRAGLSKQKARIIVGLTKRRMKSLFRTRGRLVHTSSGAPVSREG